MSIDNIDNVYRVLSFIITRLTVLLLRDIIRIVEKGHPFYGHPIRKKEGSEYMAVSDAKKKANAKWDSENMATLACKVKKEQADRFKAYCSEIGKTSNAVLRDYVLDCIGEKQDAE